MDASGGSRRCTATVWFYRCTRKVGFRTLLKVNGVGPKMALGILSTLSIDLLIHTIEHDDINTLIKVPGVGKNSRTFNDRVT